MNQRGFIPLLIIIIASIVIASAGTGVVLQKEGKLSPFIANVSRVLTGNKDASINKPESKPESKPEPASESPKPEPKQQSEFKVKSEPQPELSPKLNPKLEPESEESVAPSPNSILCNGTYWTPCIIGQRFYCPSTGDAQCLVDNVSNQNNQNSIESWEQIEARDFVYADARAWTSLISTNSLGEKRYYRKEGTSWVRKNSEAEIKQPYVVPPTTQQLLDLRRFCLSDSFINSVCQDPNFMPGYYSNEKFRLAIDDLIKTYYAILSANEQQKLVAEKAKIDCIMAQTPEDEIMMDPATQNYLRQIRCGTVTDADRTNYELSRIKSSVDELKYRLDSKISFPSFYLDPIKAPTFSNPRWEIRWEGSGGTISDSSGNFYHFRCEYNTCISY